MELRHYQKTACQIVWGDFKRGELSSLIVLPTGSGKSPVAAELCRGAVEDNKGRVIVLSHRKELLSQTSATIQRLAPRLRTGIYSAGLKRYAMEEDIIFAGIQSVYKKACDFGRRHLVIIDEVHLVQANAEGMYGRFLSDLAELNPRLRLCGLTATPYRLDIGDICGPEHLFKKISYEAKVKPLIAEGFLCPVISDTANEHVDTSKLHIRGGEFIESEMQELFMRGDNVALACREIVAKTLNRNSVIVFCAGVAHANRVVDMLEKISGHRCDIVTGESSDLERGNAISNFKAGRIKYLTNVDVLTTGFDAPNIDAIAILRASMSPCLIAQICGRGFRIHESKTDCLVMDFGENFSRFGHIDSDDYGKKAKVQSREESDLEAGAPSKVCPNCRNVVAANCRTCPHCEFQFPVNHESTSSKEQPLATPKKWRVIDVHLSRHRKAKSSGNDPDTLRVNYEVKPFSAEETLDEIESFECQSCGDITGTDSAEIMPVGHLHYARLDCNGCGKFLRWLPKPKGDGNLASQQIISAWVCLEHPSGQYAFRKAWAWWSKRSMANPYTEAKQLGCEPIEAAIDLWRRGAVIMPRNITTIQDGRWQRIIVEEFDNETPTTWQAPEVPQEPTGYDEWGQAIYEENSIPF